MTHRLPTVLVVDDDEDYLNLLVRFFSTRGYSCLAALDGREALSLYDSACPPRAVVSDFNMPNMNGLELLRSLKESEGTPPPFIMITAIASEDFRRDVEALGGFAVVEKPIHLKELLALVQAPPAR